MKVESFQACLFLGEVNIPNKAHKSEDRLKNGLIFQESSGKIPFYNDFLFPPNISAESLKSYNPLNIQDIVASFIKNSKTIDKTFDKEELNFQGGFVQGPVLPPNKYQSSNPWNKFIDFIASFIKKSKTINIAITFRKRND